MTHKTDLVNELKEAALEEFTAYFAANYPGPDTIICDPLWHAPRIFRAAERALRAALASAPEPTREDDGPLDLTKLGDVISRMGAVASDLKRERGAAPETNGGVVASEPSEARYEVVIRWSWSRYGFHEENRYHIDAPASADKVVRSLCKRVADRYGFDCGRLDQPLNPYVSSVRVVRIGTETPLDTTPFNAHLDECVEDFRVRAVRAATVRAKEGR